MACNQIFGTYVGPDFVLSRALLGFLQRPLGTGTADFDVCPKVPLAARDPRTGNFLLVGVDLVDGAYRATSRVSVGSGSAMSIGTSDNPYTAQLLSILLLIASTRVEASGDILEGLNAELRLVPAYFSDLPEVSTDALECLLSGMCENTPWGPEHTPTDVELLGFSGASFSVRDGSFVHSEYLFSRRDLESFALLSAVCTAWGRKYGYPQTGGFAPKKAERGVQLGVLFPDCPDVFSLFGGVLTLDTEGGSGDQ